VERGKPQRSWVYGVSKCCGQEALRDLDRAFAHFWRGRQEGRRVGFPRFRRKHGRRDAFRLTGSMEGSGQGSALVKPAPVKQEPSSRKLAATAAGNKRR
jgi:transposase